MDKKHIFYIIPVWFVLLLWIIFWYNFYYPTIAHNDTGCKTSTGSMACSTSGATSEKNTTKKKIAYGEFTERNQLYGKPTFLRRGANYCAYCRTRISQVEKMILATYKDQINTQLMTMDFNTSPFNTVIPQSPFDTFDFEDFTGEPCNTFPTWVVLDKLWELVSQECGGTTTIEEVTEEIKDLL